MESIILKKNVFDEGSEIVTFYTKEQGKVRGVARAVKSSKSKLAHGLQQLFLSDIEIYVASGVNRIATITGVRSIDVFKNLREDLSAIYAALFASELVLKSTADHQPNPELFDELLSLLKHLDTKEKSSHLCVDIFAIRLLDHTGYAIETDQCMLCSKAISADEAFFSIRKGGFTCLNCSGKVPDAKKVSKDVYALLSNQKNMSYAEIDKAQVSEKDLHHFADSFATHILERNLNASKYLGKME